MVEPPVRPVRLVVVEPPRRVAVPERVLAPRLAGRINYDEQWRCLHRARRGSVELVLPNTTAEIERWGVVLDNCLNIYAQAALRGHTLIVGIRDNGRLVGAMQINPRHRLVVQIEGPHNRRVPDELHDEVIALIGQLEVVDPEPR